MYILNIKLKTVFFIVVMSMAGNAFCMKDKNEAQKKDVETISHVPQASLEKIVSQITGVQRDDYITLDSTYKVSGKKSEKYYKKEARFQFSGKYLRMYDPEDKRFVLFDPSQKPEESKIIETHLKEWADSCQCSPSKRYVISKSLLRDGKGLVVYDVTKEKGKQAIVVEVCKKEDYKTFKGWKFTPSERYLVYRINRTLKAYDLIEKKEVLCMDNVKKYKIGSNSDGEYILGIANCVIRLTQREDWLIGHSFPVREPLFRDGGYNISDDEYEQKASCENKLGIGADCESCDFFIWDFKKAKNIQLKARGGCNFHLYEGGHLIKQKNGANTLEFLDMNSDLRQTTGENTLVVLDLLMLDMNNDSKGNVRTIIGENYRFSPDYKHMYCDFGDTCLIYNLKQPESFFTQFGSVISSKGCDTQLEKLGYEVMRLVSDSCKLKSGEEGTDDLMEGLSRITSCKFIKQVPCSAFYGIRFDEQGRMYVPHKDMFSIYDSNNEFRRIAEIKLSSTYKDFVFFTHYLLIALEDAVLIYDLDNNCKQIKKIELARSAFFESFVQSDQRYVFIEGRESLQIYDLQNEFEPVFESVCSQVFADRKLLEEEKGVFRTKSVAFLSQGKYLCINYSYGGEERVFIYNVARASKVFDIHETAMRSYCVTENYILAEFQANHSYEENLLQVYDLKDEKEIFKEKLQNVQACRLLTNGYLVVVYQNGLIEVRDLRSEQQESMLSIPGDAYAKYAIDYQNNGLALMVKSGLKLVGSKAEGKKMDVMDVKVFELRARRGGWRKKLFERRQVDGDVKIITADQLNS